MPRKVGKMLIFSYNVNCIYIYIYINSLLNIFCTPRNELFWPVNIFIGWGWWVYEKLFQAFLRGRKVGKHWCKMAKVISKY